MPKKKDFCSLADGKNILEIAYYGPGDHLYLEEEMGSSWFEKEILVPFLGQYSKDKTIAVIDYKDGDATRQHFGLGSSPEEAVKSALTTLIAKYEPIVASAEKALRGLCPTVFPMSPDRGDPVEHRVDTFNQRSTTMSLPAELKKVLAQVKQGDKLNCTVIFGTHSDETEISENCPLVIGKGDDPDTFYCSLAKLKTLFDPDTSKEDFIIAEFTGPSYSYLCQKKLTFKAKGWKLKLRGFMVGGYWDYTLIDPQGRAYEAGNEWSFMDSSGEKTGRPAIPAIKDILIDMTDVMAGNFENAVAKMPDFDEWVQED